MAILLDTNSRFQFTDVVIADDSVYGPVQTFGSWRKPDFLIRKLKSSEIGYFTVTPVYDGRPDKIARVLYSTPHLDWVLSAFNNAQSINWPVAGEVIAYPMPQVVASELD